MNNKIKSQMAMNDLGFTLYLKNAFYNFCCHFLVLRYANQSRSQSSKGGCFSWAIISNGNQIIIH